MTVDYKAVKMIAGTMIVIAAACYSPVKKAIQYNLDHKKDICPASIIGDTAIAVLDNRTYDSTNTFVIKFVSACGCEKTNAPDTFKLFKNNADTVLLKEKRADYAELVNNKTQVITHRPSGLYHYSKETINIALK